jgi:hypothetical protein
MNLCSREPRNAKFALADAQARPPESNRRDEMDTEENTMRELTDIELNEVAGGHPHEKKPHDPKINIDSLVVAIGTIVGASVGLNTGTVVG